MKSKYSLLIIIIFALNGLIVAQVSMQQPLDIGSKAQSFSFTDTKNTALYQNNYEGQSSNDVFYKFTLSQAMELNISHCGSELEDTYLHVLDANGNLLYENDDNNYCSNYYNSYIHIPNLQPGVYYVVSEGYGEDGNITTTIEGIKPLPPTGLYDGSAVVGAANVGTNYILSITPTVATSDVSWLGVNESMQTIQYFDGLGRPLETVQRGITPTGKDLVTLTEYDAVGREYRQWLPTASTGNGAFVAPTSITGNTTSLYDGDANPYATTEYEPSPLNRVTGQLGAGAAWNNSISPKKVKTEYGTNTASEVVYYFVNNSAKLERNSYYAANTLYKTLVTDEDGKPTTEFKDKLGRVVMTQSSTDVKTYYVYNDLGQLSFVIPPIAADALTSDGEITDLTTVVLKKFCYLYQYDERGNCIYKRLPACTPIFMVYDQANRLILSQDGNQRKRLQGGAMQWTATRYDLFGRVIFTGTMYRSESDTTANYQSIRDLFKNQLVVNDYSANNFNACSPLTISFYDNYSFLSGLSSSLNYVVDNSYDKAYPTTATAASELNAKGLLTGTRTYLLDGSGNSIVSALYYDYRGLVVQSRATNYLGGADIVYNAYNFSGKPTQTLKIHNIGGQSAVNERYTFTYDKALRPLVTDYYLNGATTPVTLTDNTNGYDELGRLISRKRHTGADSETYTYNIRNWTTSINSGTYLEQLYYNTLPTGATGTPCYNGNISYQISGVNVAALKGFYNYAYTYSYDNLNRLSTAYCYKFNTSQGAAAGHKEEYNYDKQGNINYLMRGNSSTTVDYLSFAYNGNQITSIFDYAGSQNSYTTKEYQDKNHVSGATNEMAYDTNGNLKKDLDRDIVTIQYNILNLPSVIQFKNGNQIKNLYDASGQKLRSSYYTRLTSLPVPIIEDQIATDVTSTDDYLLTGTDYSGNFEYTFSNDQGDYQFDLDKIYNNEGYIQNLTNPQYYYYRKDHLGNNREVWCANTNTTVQRTNYYPSGLPWYDVSTTGVSAQAKKYNGKEFVEMSGFDTYDYGARGMYSAIGRFTSVDPLCEKYYSISPYAYCAGNPVNRFDPDGQDYIITIDLENNSITISGTYYASSTDIASAQKATEYWNNLSGKFSFDSKDGGKGVTINFELSVSEVETDNSMTADQRSTAVSDAVKQDNSGGANGYVIVADNTLDANVNGTTKYGNLISVKDSKKNTETGSHEIGHTLGLVHNTNGLMTSSATDPNRNLDINNSDVNDMLKYPLKGMVNYEWGVDNNGNARKGVAGQGVVYYNYTPNDYHTPHVRPRGRVKSKK